MTDLALWVFIGYVVGALVFAYVAGRLGHEDVAVLVALLWPIVFGCALIAWPLQGLASLGESRRK